MHPWGHFETITKHKLLVMQYCFRIGLYKQGLLHDLSKYMPSEFLVGCKYYQGDRSPNAAEREDIGVSTAWLHHKGRNKHHYEYWIDFSAKAEHVIYGAQIPRRYVAEMAMDRVSASRNYQGKNYTNQHPLEYYLREEKRLWFIHPQTKKELKGILRILADQGEETMIHYVRDIYLKEEHNGIYKSVLRMKRKIRR